MLRPDRSGHARGAGESAAMMWADSEQPTINVLPQYKAACAAYTAMHRRFPRTTQDRPLPPGLMSLVER
jgi:hypothetical protein